MVAHPAPRAVHSEAVGCKLCRTELDGLAQAYKTPLTAILAASAGMRELGTLSPAQADLAAEIEEQARLLTELTTRTLLAARLDAEGAGIRLKPVGVEPIIDEAVARLRTCLKNKKVAIEIDDEDLILNCQRELILMLLIEYIDNACRHSIEGTAITIRAHDADFETILSVHNFGPAIPMADCEGIFGRRLPSSISNLTSGAGLGLFIAERIASFHGGEVWVTSDEAKGTTFYAAIPNRR